MDLSNVNSWVVYGVLVIFLLIFIYFWGFMKGRGSVRQRFTPPPPPPKKSSFGCLIKLLFIAALTASILALLFYTALLKSYHVFTGKQLVAVVQCQPLRDRDYDFELKLIPVIGSTRQDATTFKLRGDQWALEGNILKWKEIVNFLGLKTMYQLTRVRGRFLSSQKEESEPSSVYSLADEERAQKWKWLYKYGYKLPFVTSAYGNTVYTYPTPNKELKVYVTTSGFMVEGQKDDKSSKPDILDQIFQLAEP